MADPSELAARRQALAEAKQKLELRKQSRQKLKAAREQRQKAGDGINFGKQYVENFLKIIKESELAHEKSRQNLLGITNSGKEQKTQETGNGSQSLITTKSVRSSKYRAPGRRVNLDQSLFDTYLFKDKEKEKITFDKEIETDPSSFDKYLTECHSIEFDEKTMEQYVNEIHSNFIKSEEANAWPPQFTPERSKSVSVGPNQGTNTDDLVDWQGNYESSASPEKEEIMVLSLEEANQLFETGDFIDQFKLKAKWMERIMGINEEIDQTNALVFNYEELSFDMSEMKLQLQLKSQDSESKKIRQQLSSQKLDSNYIGKDALKLTKQFIHSNFHGRSIGSLELSHINNDWFLASYLKRGQNAGYSTEPDGCVNIWNFVIPNNPEYTLYSDSMITTAKFHPFNNSIIFGTSMSGQILSWDIRTRNYSRPVSRTTFANGHASPVFDMSFLPTMNSKNQHFVTVSNDGKVCTWRDTDLSETTAEIILKVDESNQAQGGLQSSVSSSTSRALELGTTCFSYSTKEWNVMTFGSDEGNIYRAEIHGGSKVNEGKSDGVSSSKKSGLSDSFKKKKDVTSESESVNVLESIDKAHDGPITSLRYNLCEIVASTIQNQRNYTDIINSLYLTSSYDWSVKLWHNKHHTHGPVAVFDSMSDYVYDVAWNNKKPGLFVTGDGTGKIHLFNLSQDFESPIFSTVVPKDKILGRKNSSYAKPDLNESVKAVTKLEFTKKGNSLLAGDSDGMVHMYRLDRNLWDVNEEDFEQVFRKVQGRIKDFDQKA